MRVIFVDSLYFIAMLFPDDQWHDAARRVVENLTGAERFVTTYDVLTEFLASASRSSPETRMRAVETVRDAVANDDITIVPQSADLFARGLELYANRPDKRYSLTDCISMIVMQDMDITEALTHDRDFESEGFIRLIR